MTANVSEVKGGRPPSCHSAKVSRSSASAAPYRIDLFLFIGTAQAAKASIPVVMNRSHAAFEATPAKMNKP